MRTSLQYANTSGGRVLAVQAHAARAKCLYTLSLPSAQDNFCGLEAISAEEDELAWELYDLWAGKGC